MSPVLVGNVNPQVQIFSALLTSCVSLSFWNANQQPYGLNSAIQTAEAVFTTATTSYVCDSLARDTLLLAHCMIFMMII